MAVAKGPEIPKARMLDAIEATAHARTVFNEWAAMDAPELPPDDVDAMQVTLARWQSDRFAGAPTSDVHMALGVIEELGEAFDEDASPEDSVDALGDVMVYSAQLCTANRLAVRPVIDLAVLYLKANHCHAQPVCLAGMLAHVALKHDQKIRGLGPAHVYHPRLVDALALMIAKALEDCTIGHELTIDPKGVFMVIGREVTQRKQGDAMIPASNVALGVIEAASNTAVDKATAQADAVAKMHEAIDSLGPGAVADPDTVH